MSTDVLAIIAITLGALTRALGSDLPGFKSLSKAWRAVIVTGLGAVQGIVDMAAAGSPFSVAALAVLKTTVPSFVLLVIEAVFGGGSGDGTKTVAGKMSIRPDAPAGPYSAKMVGRAALAVVLAFACFAATGCGQLTQQKLNSVIDEVSEYLGDIQEALSLLSAVRSLIDGATHGAALASPSAQKLDRLLSDADMALDNVQRAKDEAKGVISSPQVVAAIAAFDDAWTALSKGLKDEGINFAAPKGHMMVFAGKVATLDVRPLLLQHASRKVQ